MSNSHITYDAAGYPSAGYLPGSPVIMSASGSNNNSGSSVKPKVAVGEVQPSILEAYPNGFPWVSWGNSNDYPRQAIQDFRQNGVARRALKLKAEMLYGKRVITCKVTGFDEQLQKETVETVIDPQVNDFLKRININSLRTKFIHDFSYWGMFCPMFLMNDDRSQIVMVAHDKMAKYRFAPFNLTLGRIDSVFRSANWPNPMPSQYEEIKAINPDMSALEIDRVKLTEKGYRYIYPVKSYDELNDYYVVTILESLRINGTLENSNNIPALVKSMIKNVTTIKYHIKIPISYWKGLYPKWDAMAQKEKDAIVNAKLDEMGKFLSGKDNQMKAFISHYAVDPITNKEVAGWEIVALDDKMKYDAWTNVDTATTANILFTIGINPAIFGLGAPGGAGTGGNTNGGSNIREAWLTMLAGAQSDRDILYSWWPFVRDYNGFDPEIELRTVDQVLTTLDQGRGTAKTLS